MHVYVNALCMCTCMSMICDDMYLHSELYVQTYICIRLVRMKMSRWSSVYRATTLNWGGYTGCYPYCQGQVVKQCCLVFGWVDFFFMQIVTHYIIVHHIVIVFVHNFATPDDFQPHSIKQAHSVISCAFYGSKLTIDSKSCPQVHFQLKYEGNYCTNLHCLMSIHLHFLINTIQVYRLSVFTSHRWCFTTQQWFDSSW